MGTLLNQLIETTPEGRHPKISDLECPCGRCLTVAHVLEGTDFGARSSVLVTVEDKTAEPWICFNCREPIVAPTPTNLVVECPRCDDAMPPKTEEAE